jgi:hypothetical protein
MIIRYALFAMATFGVLMLMDVMECFLHALRLHWYLKWIDSQGGIPKQVLQGRRVLLRSLLLSELAKRGRPA